MKLEVTLDEANHIIDALGNEKKNDKWQSLYDELCRKRDAEQELAEMDLDDCAGGACKL